MKPHLFGGIDNDLPEFKESVCVFVDHFDIKKKEFKNADYRVFVQIEPREIIDPKRIIEIHNQFDLILSWNEEVLEACPNSQFFAFGSCWIPKDQQKIHEKSKKVSIIASDKKFLAGHQLRHDVVSRFKDQMDVYGRGYKYVESKTEALNDYMFSIVIENVQYNNWFTEKLIDCFRTGTIPVYWGCPNIDQYFDAKGFIFFNSLDELDRILKKLDKKQYDSMMEHTKQNFEMATEYAENYYIRLHKIISENIITNPPKRRFKLLRRIKTSLGL